MDKENLKILYDSGILKAWLDDKDIQCKYDNGWGELIGCNLYDLSGLITVGLRVKPEPIKKTLEWFRFSDETPNICSSIIFSEDDMFWTVKLDASGYKTLDRNLTFYPNAYMYWAYVDSPDELPF